MITLNSTRNKADDARLRELIAALETDDGLARQRARLLLLREGRHAVPYLIDALFSADERTRLEAARVLNEIADPAAASALVIGLEDRASSVRWRAAEALIALGAAALPALLHALRERSDAVLLRESAHQVIYALVGRRELKSTLTPVLAALEGAEPVVSVPLAAQRALDSLAAQSGDRRPADLREMLVRDWMTPEPYTVSPQTKLPQAEEVMRTHRIRRLPVVEHGQLVGILTLGDIREARPSDATTLSILEARTRMADLRVDQIMTRNVVTLLPDETLTDAAQRMLEYKISGLPVLEHGKVVGIITESDIFRALVKNRRPVGEPERVLV